MRNVVNNNFSYVTAEFAYHGGTGYLTAYTGRTDERAWLTPFAIKGCKSRDEAELKALLYLINGDPRKETYAATGASLYQGFNKNARIQLFGFDTFEKGVRQKHTKNVQMWKDVLELFGSGRNGLRFDLIRINDSWSSAIRNANTYGWTASNRGDHARYFDALVKAAVKSAKAAASGIAKTEAAPKAVVVPAPVAKAERTALEAKIDSVMEGVA